MPTVRLKGRRTSCSERRQRSQEQTLSIIHFASSSKRLSDIWKFSHDELQLKNYGPRKKCRWESEIFERFLVGLVEEKMIVVSIRQNIFQTKKNLFS